MKRRHLFDNGYPVCTPTLLAGAEVLLAVARESLRRSREQLAVSHVALAGSIERVAGSAARHGASERELREWRQRCGTLLGHGQRLGTTARI